MSARKIMKTQALEVLQNSITRDVQYVKYLGDGDSNKFQSAVECEPCDM